MADNNLWNRIEPILPLVSRPSRYVDHEVNARGKKPEKDMVKVALAYPDLYEVGLPNLGLQILYEIINDRADALCDRAYAPAPDFETQLREHNIPLFSWELTEPLARFDIVGFTLQSELDYTNILNMLDLAGITMRSEARREGEPLVLAGGPLAFNPEPLASFLDAVVLGDAEEVICEIIDLLQQLRSGASRSDVLKALAGIPGVYVPALYKVEYRDTGCVTAVVPLIPEAPAVIEARVIPDLDSVPVPKRPLLPYNRVVHDRAVVEIMRGCTRGCRFCLAGYIYRPVRERDPGTVLEALKVLLRNSGFSEVSLLSLSTADYTALLPLVGAIMEDASKTGVSLSLPSLRPDSFSVDLATQISRVKRTGLTFAVEAGSQRLRNVINKGLTETDFLDTVQTALEAGWRRFKVYFMVGLPTESRDDLEALVELVKAVLDLGGRTSPSEQRRTLRMVINVASFVPKPHTPFQWVAQDSKEVLIGKIAYLKKALKGRREVEFRWHEVEMSLLESLLSRGDRRMGAVLEKAWRQGARFDQWSEHFDFSRWKQAFADEGLEMAFYTSRPREKEEILPWEHLSSGIDREFLWREYQAALSGELTADCRSSSCPKCGLCPAYKVGNRLADKGASLAPTPGKAT